MYAVGDFYQHTFDTSRDGNVNSGLHDDLTKYKARLGAAGFDVDSSSFTKSYRCSPSVCRYVRERLGIEIESHRDDETAVVPVETIHEARDILADPCIPKLFYQKHYVHECNSNNWGASKGDQHEHVCVVLNKTAVRALAEGGVSSLNPQTRNKLYVACTRGRGNLYIVSEDLIKKCKK